MLVYERGPGNLFMKLREATGIIHDDEGNQLAHSDWTPLYCIWCTSLWVAPVVFIAVPLGLVLWLAISAGAIIVNEKLTR